MSADGAIVVADASVVISALLIDGRARAALRLDDVHVPHLVDSEVMNVLRRQVAAGALPADEVPSLLRSLRDLGVMRHAIHGLADRIWELRDNVSSYDAAYVALAEAIECPLVTADRRLARAPGLRCSVTVLPG